jgi:hypothetical protein
MSLVESAEEMQCTLNVVHGLARLQLFEKPKALLCKRERGGLRMFALEASRLRVPPFPIPKPLRNQGLRLRACGYPRHNTFSLGLSLFDAVIGGNNARWSDERKYDVHPGEDDEKTVA